MPRQFWLVSVFGLSVLLVIAVWLDTQRTHAYNLAQNMGGQAWYRIDLQGQHVGYMTTQSAQDVHGRLHFDNTTHFSVADGQPSTIIKRLTFAATPPHELRHAYYESRLGSKRQAVTVRALPTNQTLEGPTIPAGQASISLPAATPYVVDLQRQAQRSEKHVTWHYELADFLDFEVWLDAQAPNSGATNTVKNLDFERLSITQRAFRVVETNATGYVIETNSPFAATTTQLDGDFLPVELKMAGLFDFKKVPPGQAIPTQQIKQKPHYVFALDRALPEHERISELVLALQPPQLDVLPSELKITAGYAAPPGPEREFLSETLRHRLYLAVPFVPFERIGMALEIGLTQLLGIFLISLPLLLFAAGLLTSVASFAKSYKEAQTYLTMVILVPTLPLIFAQLTNLETTLGIMFVPSLSQATLMADIIKGESVEALHIATSMVTTTVYGALLAWLSIYLYRREQILG